MLAHYKGGHITMPNALCTLVLVNGELQTMRLSGQTRLTDQTKEKGLTTPYDH